MRRNQDTGNTNSGIAAGGSVFGSTVQSGNSNSTVVNTNSVGADVAATIAQRWDEIRQAMAAQRASIPDYEQCVGWLQLAAEQRLTEVEGRITAKSILQKLAEKCGGAPGVVSMISSLLSLIASL
jgi:hypothetical protein